MNVTYSVSDDLPEGVEVAIVEGDSELVILLDRHTPRDRLAATLSATMTEYVAQAWMHVGRVRSGVA